MSRIKLPDHRVKTDEIVIEFSADQLKRLRSEFGFHDMYALEMKLRYLAIFFEKQIYYFPPPSLKEQKKLLKAIYQSAETLEEALERIGPKEHLRIGKHNNYWDRLNTIEVVSETKEAAKLALADLNDVPTTMGPPAKDKERQLIFNLIRIYREGTRKTDRYYQDSHTYQFTGRLVSFIEDVVKILGAPIENQFIGKEIKKSP